MKVVAVADEEAGQVLVAVEEEAERLAVELAEAELGYDGVAGANLELVGGAEDEVEAGVRAQGEVALDPVTMELRAEGRRSGSAGLKATSRHLPSTRSRMIRPKADRPRQASHSPDMAK
ncbi:hypothetical protein [Nonomuraea fuscirosea]|uniref:hypothetical protein n=1 Tax=Nonomuraea fuscirosea TaxID=1291556 RepID=UPI0034497D3F